MKYNEKDFEKVAQGKKTIQEMCEYYGVSREAFILAMNRKKYYVKKTKIKIVSPTKTKIVYSFSACAYELKVSEQTIRNYLKGKRVKLFEDLGIRIEVVER
jgi:hypothetical protein